MTLTLDRALQEAARLLDADGIENARLDARILLAHAIGGRIEDIICHPDRVLSYFEQETFAKLIKRRGAREPVAYITGIKEFWSLEFQVTQDTLIPRADSETVIETALRLVPERDRGLRILDMGTGSGCLVAALLAEYTKAWGLGLDRKLETLTIARGNAVRLGLGDRISFVMGDWENALGDSLFDLVVANPPYIPDAEWKDLAADVRVFEPEHALKSGPDGLDDIRRILVGLPRILNDGGMAVIEFGLGQANAVCDFARSVCGLHVLSVEKDLAGHERCLAVRHKTI